MHICKLCNIKHHTTSSNISYDVFLQHNFVKFTGHWKHIKHKWFCWILTIDLKCFSQLCHWKSRCVTMPTLALLMALHVVITTPEFSAAISYQLSIFGKDISLPVVSPITPSISFMVDCSWQNFPGIKEIITQTGMVWLQLAGNGGKWHSKPDIQAPNEDILSLNVNMACSKTRNPGQILRQNIDHT